MDITKIIHPNYCPDHANHTQSPDDYVQFHNWAKRMQTNHTQIQCKTCKFWCIWVLKSKQGN